MSALLSWFSSHEQILLWLGLGSVLTFIASLIAIPYLVVQIPADYFAQPGERADRWRDAHPALRTLILIIKNTLGAILLLAGLAMLVLPGQGIITVLIGLLLMNFPGKRRLERWIVSRPRVLHAMNWIRARAKHAPLLPPDYPAD